MPSRMGVYRVLVLLTRNEISRLLATVNLPAAQPGPPASLVRLVPPSPAPRQNQPLPAPCIP